MQTRPDTTSEAARRAAPPRRRLAFALLLTLGVLAAVALVLLARRGPSTRARNASSAAHEAIVRRRNLVETDTESGTLGYAGSQSVYDRLSGTITWLPRVGAVVKRGATLFDVDERPVILLYGSRPAYRELRCCDERGRDVGELNANLVALGYGSYGIVDDESWQTATTDAVEALQRALGEKPTGKLALGRIVFLPGPQLVDAIEGAIGSPTSFDRERATSAQSAELVDATSSATADRADVASVEASTVSPAAPRPASTTTSTTSSVTSTTVTQTVTVTESTSTTAAQPRRSRSGAGSKSNGDRSSGAAQTHNGRLGSEGSRGAGARGGKAPDGNSVGADSGRSESRGGDPGAGKTGNSGGEAAPPKQPSSSNESSGTGGVAILKTSSTRLVATVDLAAGLQSEAVVGSHVTVELPDGSIVNGTVSAVSRVASSARAASGTSGEASGGSAEGSGEGAGSSASVPVTIALDSRLKGGGFDQAPVSVDFARASARHVLSVPVTALVATAGNAYAVQEASAPHRLIAVTTGLFAGGYVQISGSGVHPGLRVTDSQG